MINIEDITDDALFRVITEGRGVKWNFFALEVMISRLKLMITMSNSKELTKQRCISDLREMFTKSKLIPSAKKDLNLIIELFVKEEQNLINN
jgi:hypothetical protein